MITEYQTPSFEWAYSSQYGVGRFIRKSDGAVTMLETGSDCDRLRDRLQRLAILQPGRNPNSFNLRGQTIFDSIANEYTFDDALVPTPWED